MPKINAAPCLDAIMERWLTSFARRNLWRVAVWYDIEDLIADGYMVFVQCRNKYWYVTERKHFMALFQRCYFNHITDLANKHSRDSSGYLAEVQKEDNGTTDGDRRFGQRWRQVQVTNEADTSPDRGDGFDRLVPPDFPVADLSVLLSQAKGPVKAVLELFTTDAGLERLRSIPQGAHEHTNRYLCRLLGLDPKSHNLPELVRSFVSGQGMYWLHTPQGAGT